MIIIQIFFKCLNGFIALRRNDWTNHWGLNWRNHRGHNWTNRIRSLNFSKPIPPQPNLL